MFAPDLDSTFLVQWAPGPGTTPARALLARAGVDAHDREAVTRLLGEQARAGARVLVRGAPLGRHFALFQDATAEAAQDLAFAPRAPLLESLREGQHRVGAPDAGHLLSTARAAAAFQEALRWCAPDYADLLPEFADQLDPERVPVGADAQD